MSFLVLTDNEALLLDAGTGVARLLEPKIARLLSPYNCLNIILSHYHLDHVVGLSYLPAIAHCQFIRLYAPDRPFVETTPEAALSRLLEPPLFGLPISKFPIPVDVIPLTSEHIDIGSLSISLRAQKHPGGSVGIRIEDTIAYITDTIIDEETPGFASDVRILLHEVWFTDSEMNYGEATASGHSHASGVGGIAKKANVGQLWIVHHQPKRSNPEIHALARQIAQIASVEVHVPEESRLYKLT